MSSYYETVIFLLIMRLWMSSYYETVRYLLIIIKIRGQAGDGSISHHTSRFDRPLLSSSPKSCLGD